MALNRVSLNMLENAVVVNVTMAGNVLTVEQSDGSSKTYALAIDGGTDVSQFLTQALGDARYALKGEGGGGTGGVTPAPGTENDPNDFYVRKDRNNTYSMPLQFIKHDITDPAEYISFGWTAQLKSFVDCIVSPGALHGHGMGFGGTIWGLSTEAWTGDQYGPPTGPIGEHILDSIEAAVISQYDKNTQPLIGVNSVFKNRPDDRNENSSPFLGKGGNRYNTNSWAYWISSQRRSTAGEYCGWFRGIKFDAYSMDRSMDGKAIAIDMGDLVNPEECDMIKFPDQTIQNSGRVAFRADGDRFNDAVPNMEYLKIRFQQRFNYGNGGTWDPVNNRFVASAKGVYKFDVSVDIHNPNSADAICAGFLMVWKNGSLVKYDQSLSTVIPRTTLYYLQNVAFTINGLIEAVPGDYFEVYMILSRVGASLSVSPHELSRTYVCIEKAF